MTEMPRDPEDARAGDQSGMCSRAPDNDTLERGRGGGVKGVGGGAVVGEGRSGYF